MDDFRKFQNVQVIFLLKKYRLEFFQYSGWNFFPDTANGAKTSAGAYCWTASALNNTFVWKSSRLRMLGRQSWLAQTRLSALFCTYAKIPVMFFFSKRKTGCSQQKSGFSVGVTFFKKTVAFLWRNWGNYVFPDTFQQFGETNHSPQNARKWNFLNLSRKTEWNCNFSIFFQILCISFFFITLISPGLKQILFQSCLYWNKSFSDSKIDANNKNWNLYEISLLIQLLFHQEHKNIRVNSSIYVWIKNLLFVQECTIENLVVSCLASQAWLTGLSEKCKFYCYASVFNHFISKTTHLTSSIRSWNENLPVVEEGMVKNRWFWSMWQFLFVQNSKTSQ